MLQEQTHNVLDSDSSDPNTSTEQRLHIPKSILTGNEKEFDDELQVTFGSLPKNIHGHVFIVGALPQPQEPGSQIYNGDGMIYRIDFTNTNDVITAKLKSRIAKTPCYYADKATQTEKYQKYQFRSYGLARVGRLGSRNQLNTGFLPMNGRLLVTFDAGRPYEIDPEKIELIQPVGSTSEWIGAFSSLQRSNSIFLTYFTPAHPAYDFENEAVFTVNYSTGFSRMLPQWLRQIIKPSIKKDFLEGFTDLARYRLNTGKPELERWRLFLENDDPVIIEQSLHQIALTRNYIVLADIAFPLEISQVLFNIVLKLVGLENLKYFPKEFKRWISSTFLSLRKQQPFTNLYIVKRKDLEGDFSTDGEPRLPVNKVKKLIAKKVVIPREVSHFIADYDNKDEHITIHLAHNNAWDVTEWIREDDEPAPNNELRVDLAGLVVGPMDVGFLGRYVIDGKSGALLKSRIVSDPDLTWSISLYTHRALESLGKIKNIYWLSWGFSMEIVPKRIFEAYQNYEYRGLPLENFDTPGEYCDKPVQLLRLNTELMEIEDRYSFEPEYFASSPQFVPCLEGNSENVEGSTDGYIVCTVFWEDKFNPLNSKDEIWIFDARDLKKGAICKLGHKELDLKLTIHSTWLSNLKSPDNPESVENLRYQSVRDDYHEFVKNNFPKLINFFEQEVYKKYASQESVSPSEEKCSRIES